MWIELLQDIGEHKANKFLEVSDEIGRSYIAAKLAKDGGDGPDVVLFQRSLEVFRTEMRGMVEGTAKAIQDATAAIKRTPNIRIDNGESEADKSKGLGDFVRNIVRASDPRDPETMQGANERLTKEYGVKRVMTEGAGASFGYTTPVIYESMILKEEAEQSVIVGASTEVPLGARQVEWPALNQFTAPTKGQSAMFGGIQVYRKGETRQRTETDPKATKVVLMAQDMTCYTEISRDVMQDSAVTLDAMIPLLMGGAIAWREDWEALQGIGNGQFLGIYNSPAFLTVARATANTITFPDVASVYSRLLPSCKKNAVWLIHPFTISTLLTIQDGAGRYIYIPNWPGATEGPAGASPSGRLLGLPVIETEKAPVLGATGDLTLVDRKKYLVGRRSGLEIGLSEHFKWDTDEIAIRAKVRNDGAPWLKAPIYLADGSQSNQVSAFVGLLTK
jgi:HK97 family phage major capsid protein